MYIQLKVNPYSINESTVQTVSQDNPIYGFPICRIDRDSYVIDALITTPCTAHNGFIPYNFQIGKSTSIGPNISFLIDANHDYLAPSQGIIKCIDPSDSSNRNLIRKGELIIENDCWIGRGATIMSGLTIHNGAIVAADAVVTKDVPPYAIVAGNPARVIRYRFSEDVVKKLLQIKWWDWNEEQLIAAGADLRGNIHSFVEKYAPEEKKVKKSEERIRIQTDSKQYVLFVDNQYMLKQFRHCLDEFCKAFEHQNVEFLICIPSEQPELVDRITKIMNEYEKYEVFVNLLAYNEDEAEQIIAQTDAYITNSSQYNISRLDMAEERNIPVVSGFNVPMIWGNVVN